MLCHYALSPTKLCNINYLDRNGQYQTTIVEFDDSSVAINDNHAKSMRHINLRRRFKRESARHAVCAVQVFKNEISGPLLFQFSMYYLTMGWLVIIYDRFRSHYNDIVPCMNNHNFRYHPFSAFELINPEYYSKEFEKKQVTIFDTH